MRARRLRAPRAHRFGKKSQPFDARVSALVVENDSGAEQTVAVGDVQQVVPNASSLAFPDLVRFPGLSTRSVPVRVGAQQQDLDVVPLTPIPRP